MKYLRLFETEAEYTAATLDYPNVAYISATDRVAMEKDAPTPVATYKARLTLTGGTTVDIPLNGSSTLTQGDLRVYSATCASVEITTAVTSIGDAAFNFYTNISSITIPNSVTSIGNWAFSVNYSLTSMTIPSSVTSIGYGAFSSCSGLTSITVDSNNAVYDSRNNCNAIIETSTNKLVQGCKNTLIPNTVTSIGDDAFYGCSGLESINIPNSVTSIGNGAFIKCEGLTSVTIGNGVTSIGSNAFLSCTSLYSLTIPDNVIGIDSYAFSEWNQTEQDGLFELTLGSGLISLGEQTYIPYIKVKTTNFDGYPCSFGETIDEWGSSLRPSVIDYETDEPIEIDWCTDCGCCDPCDENGDCYDPCADPGSWCYDPSQCEGGDEEPSEE